MAPAIIGTLLITGVAALMAIPLGVLGAIYLNEYGKHSPLARTIRTMADVMTGVPSIVMGLFIYIGLVLLTESERPSPARWRWPASCCRSSSGPARRCCAWCPTSCARRASRSARRKWRTTVSVVMPASISGITSGALLAIARAAGETAPICS